MTPLRWFAFVLLQGSLIWAVSRNLAAGGPSTVDVLLLGGVQVALIGWLVQNLSHDRRQKSAHLDE